MDNSDLIFSLTKKMLQADKYFKGTKYEAVLKKALYYFSKSDFTKCELELSTLPTMLSLLTELFGKLKGKSVYKSIQKVFKDKSASKLKMLKVLFSLGTHTVIECEKGRLEFRLLLDCIYSKLGEVIMKDNISFSVEL